MLNLNIKDNLDKRICDCEEEATNTETYRDFLEQGEMEFFGLLPYQIKLDELDDIQLNQLLELIDYLWSK